jgi:hypothetical protein
MHISELIVEQKLDELSLAGIGKGIGKVAGGIGQAVGNVQGAWQGAKDAYGQNRDRVAKVAQRNISRAGGYKAPRPSPDQGQTTQDPNAPKQLAPQGQQPPAGAAGGAPTGSPAMKAAEIVQGLNDIWSKATANQDSQTSSPQVQQQIIAMAKQAALAGRKIENRKHTRPVVVEFHSKFLGRML